jgi:hypothetical protein
VRLDPGCFGLDNLGSAHFTVLRGYEGIQCHVLSFEGRDPVSPVFENAAERGSQDAFPNIGACS